MILKDEHDAKKGMAEIMSSFTDRSPLTLLFHCVKITSFVGLNPMRIVESMYLSTIKLEAIKIRRVPRSRGSHGLNGIISSAIPTLANIRAQYKVVIRNHMNVNVSGKSFKERRIIKLQIFVMRP